MTDAGQVEFIEGREAMLAALIEVLQTARLTLDVQSACLEPALYQNPQFLEALKKQLLDARRLQVRVLISDPRRASQHADPFKELARRLSSQFTIHQPLKPELGFEEECLIADGRAFFFRDTPLNRNAQWVIGNGLATDTHCKRFAEAWRQSSRSVEFRPLN